MSVYEKNSLESIIKVEPEKFQEYAVDNTLRSKSNISDPIVHVERLDVTAYDVLRFRANM